MNLKIKTTFLLFGLLIAFSSNAQNRWLPEGDYRLYESPSGVMGYEATVQNSSGDTIQLNNYTQFQDKRGLYLVDGKLKDFYHYVIDTVTDMLPAKYVPSQERVSILQNGLWLKNSPIASDNYNALNMDTSGNTWSVQSEAQWTYSSAYQDSALRITFDIHDAQGNPADHPWNGKHLLFGKEKGLLEFPNKFGSIARLIFSEAQSFGKAPRTWEEIHDVEVGAEIHVISIKWNRGVYDSTLRIHRVLSNIFQNGRWIRIDSIWEGTFRRFFDSSGVLSDRDFLNNRIGIDTLIQSELTSGKINHRTGINGWNDTMNRFLEFNATASFDPSLPLRAEGLTRADFIIDSTPPFAYINWLHHPQDVTREWGIYYSGLGGPYHREYLIGYSVTEYVAYAKTSTMEWGQPLNKSEVLSTPSAGQRFQVKLYPNPASSQIHLSGLHGSFQYQVSNIRGQLVLNGEITPSKPIVKTSSLQPGVYFIHLYNERGTAKAKFIIR